MGIINVERVIERGKTRKKIFVYESATHHHGVDEKGKSLNKEGVQKVELNYYINRDWYVRKRNGSWNVQLNESNYTYASSLGKYRKGYNHCMWDWWRARIRCWCCCRYSKKTFCSEYVAAQLGLEESEIMTPRDLAYNTVINYEPIEGPLIKPVPSYVSQTVDMVRYRF